MPFTSGTADVGEDPVLLCAVSIHRVNVKNLGATRVYLGGADVGNEGAKAGYPLDPGQAEAFALGQRVQEEFVVPAPFGDTRPPELYARTAPGTSSQVAWITPGS